MNTEPTHEKTTAPGAPHAEWRYGTVISYKPLEKHPVTGAWRFGFGFILPDDGSRDVLVERRVIAGNENKKPTEVQFSLAKGQRVRYTVIKKHFPPKAQYVELDDGETNQQATDCAHD